MIVFSCPRCNQKLQIQDEWAGKKVQCAGCKGVVPVPQAPSPALTPGARPTAPLSPPPRPVRNEADTPTLEVPSGSGGPAQGDTDSGITSINQLEREQYSFLAPPLRPDELGRLGRYRVLKVLGTGGMGIVFEAEDVMLRRTVALKAMLPRVAAQDANRRRFLREAQSTAAIEHDHIVTIYEVGEVQNIPFLAMALLRGEALDQRLRRTPRLPLADLLRIGREIAEGLAAAHERGLIHRDIKPANIWLEGSRGRVKVLDFGLARIAEDTNNLTKVGDLLGTPAYMAPEQAAGVPIDHRCDLFSLGCVLYQMGTGELPFQGVNAVHVVVAVATMDPAPIETLTQEMPPELCSLVMSLLAKEPRDRPGSAREVAEAMEVIEATYISRPASSPELTSQRYQFQQPLRPPGRGRRTAAVVAALVLILVLGAWTVWQFLSRHSTRELLCLRGHSNTVNAVAFSPDGKYLASGSRDQSIKIWHPDTGKVIKTLTEAGDGILGLAYSPRDRLLASANIDGTVWLWNPDTGENLRILKEHTSWVKAVAFSADGQYLASGSGDKTVRIWDPKTGKSHLTLNKHLKNITGVAFHPTRSLLASCSWDRTICLWDSTTGKMIRSFKGHADEVTSVAFSPDGKYLASASVDRTVRIWYVETGSPRLILPGHTDGVNAVAYSSDGKLLASAGADKTVRLWDGTTGKELAVLQGHEADVLAVAFRPDGRCLASASRDGTVRIWEVPARQ